MPKLITIMTKLRFQLQNNPKDLEKQHNDETPDILIDPQSYTTPFAYHENYEESKEVNTDKLERGAFNA